jgi:hypothetical protein
MSTIFVNDLAAKTDGTIYVVGDTLSNVVAESDSVAAKYFINRWKCIAKRLDRPAFVTEFRSRVSIHSFETIVW